MREYKWLHSRLVCASCAFDVIQVKFLRHFSLSFYLISHLSPSIVMIHHSDQFIARRQLQQQPHNCHSSSLLLPVNLYSFYSILKRNKA
ncbi:hypothetical protein GQ42DRAFT_86699 [Ramicandelaber brevisporus]|nr:hypothetical protein GQ42DRAFT_86699 [Ramicandelaber brevisporus]